MVVATTTTWVPCTVRLLKHSFELIVATGINVYNLSIKWYHRIHGAIL